MFNSNAAPQLAANYVQTAAPPPIVPTEAYELDARCYTLEDEYANIDDEDAAGLGISMTTLESRYKTQVISARAPARVVARRNRQHNPASADTTDNRYALYTVKVQIPVVHYKALDSVHAVIVYHQHLEPVFQSDKFDKKKKLEPGTLCWMKSHHYRGQGINCDSQVKVNECKTSTVNLVGLNFSGRTGDIQYSVVLLKKETTTVGFIVDRYLTQKEIEPRY
ncbi:hypothetical protein CVT25_004229 [Psilocybe cyanescens]|uniref:Uncharacterized protein n=1 Tax=Psilocybe cyanescens TaxID=93625 RepID=A0A409X301_PSICY|nr:hypothetical protein CVT25_004229 [Psilocybe cyanescens]